MTYLERLGLAIVRPRWALAIAGDRRNAGRSGSDLLLAIVLFLAATRLRGIFVSSWVVERIGTSVGIGQLFGVLTSALTMAFTFLAVGAAVLFAAGGVRRELGRAFDLACVAILPMVLVELGATSVVRALDIDVPDELTYVLAGLAYAWAGALFALAIGTARSPRSSRSPELPAGEQGRARLAGRGVALVALIGIALQIQYIATHLDDLRPITIGDDPTLALRTIGPGGAPGPEVTLAGLRGKPVVIDFWATYCGPCLSSMPALDAVTRKHPEVAVLSVNLDKPELAREIFDRGHYAMTLLADDGETAERFNVDAIPHLVLIDRDGHMRDVIRGAGGDLEARISALAK